MGQNQGSPDTVSPLPLLSEIERRKTAELLRRESLKNQINKQYSSAIFYERLATKIGA